MKEIKNKLLVQKEKFNKTIIEEINNIFESKKSYIFHLYYLFNKINNNQVLNLNINSNKNTSFVLEMKNNFRKKSKIIILETLQFIYNNQNKGGTTKFIYIFHNPKLSCIDKVVLNEKFLIIYFINIFVKLKNLLDIFLYYYNSIILNNEKENETFKNEIKSIKNDFYEIFDKHISKTIILIENLTISDDYISISKQNIFYIINLICLFEKLLKNKFNVKYNKFINLALKNYLINKFKFENKKILEKSILLLSDISCEKKLLDDSIFQVHSIKEQVPFYLKRFISFFNESEIKDSWISKLVNKDNIDDIFNYIINSEECNINDLNIKNINFDDIIISFINKEGKIIYRKEVDNENNLIIFNTPLNYNKSYVNNSSFVLIKGIEEQIINIILFDSLVYDIFNNLFDTIDLYIFILLKSFIEESRFKQEFLVKLNENDIEKSLGNIDYLSNIIFFQKKYLEIKKFYDSIETKFKKYFEEEISLNNGNESNFCENLIYNYTIKNNINSKNEENGINIEPLEKQYESKGKETLQTENNNQEEDIEVLNINEINKGKENISNNKTNIKSKKLFNFFRNSDNKIIQTKNNELIDKEVINEEKIKNLKKVIILISCILTIKKILKRLISFSTKIELELERYEVLCKINKYEKIIEQMQSLIYLEFSYYILDFSKISDLIINYNWSPSPEEGSKKLFDASEWVKKLKIIFEKIINEINNELLEQFGGKKLSEFLNIFIKYIVNLIQDSFSQIKKCNDMGRSIMLKDIKLLKEDFSNALKKFELIKKIKIENLFDVIIQYINSWYYNCDELYQFIFNYNLEYKYFENIFYSSPIIEQLAFGEKNDFLKKVKQNYVNKFKKIILSINKGN